jgi:Endonuclease/Exonuclease/phosphatase family
LRGWGETVLSKKVDQLATIVNRMNEEKGPDLLGVCEVENRRVLDRLKEKIDSVRRRNYDVIRMLIRKMSEGLT